MPQKLPQICVDCRQPFMPFYPEEDEAGCIEGQQCARCMNSQLLSQVGQTIRRFRVSKSLSQQQLGDVLGRDQEYVSRLENGETDVDLLTLKECAVALGQDPVDFIVQASAY